MAQQHSSQFIDAVECFMGTGFGPKSTDGLPRPWGLGNMTPGPQLPWGSINPSPDTPETRSNGYNPQRPIRGFSQLHVSGTGGSGKYGLFLLSPQLGLAVEEEGHDSPKADEIARPGYYAVTLTRYGVRVEITCTHHAALYRFTFPAASDAHLVLDLAHNIPGDSHFRRNGGYPAAADVFVNPHTGETRGWGRFIGGWGDGVAQAHVALQVSRPPQGAGTWMNGTVAAGHPVAATNHDGDRIGAFLRFDTTEEPVLLVKVGVSMQSIARAASFLAEEIPDWDFDAIRAAHERQWEALLGQVELSGADDDTRRRFYTCLYRSMMMPRDRTGDQPVWSSDEPYYDDHYCVWDTFRTVHPLITLLRPAVARDIVRSFVDRWRQGGPVMDAFIAGRELMVRPSQQPGVAAWWGGMGGDMVDVVLADAFAKGVPGIDWQAAYGLLRYHADHLRCDPYREEDRGWIPVDQAVNRDGTGLRHPGSFTIEMAYTDYCVAQVARGLGQTEAAARYLARSRRWVALWNPEMTLDGWRGFISVRDRAGVWHDDAAAGDNHAFAEGTTWDYSHFVPHDLARLVRLNGGPAAYAEKLDYTLRQGKVTLDNEPTFLLLHVFIYCQRPDLCAFWVRQHLRDYTLETFPGPDDSGAMASWFVFAALGFLPNAGQDLYLINGPLVPKATLHLADGASLHIEAPGVSDTCCYVQAATLNGRPLDRAWFRHGEIADGGHLVFVMGETPSDWGTQTPPPSLPDDHGVPAA